MNIKKEATKDAIEFARAQMAYGQGAGTRRKLIKATVDHKADTVPGYLSAFYAASRKVDMTALAAEAKRNRRTKDVATAVGKNAKGLATGNYPQRNQGELMIMVISMLVLLVAGMAGWIRGLQKTNKRLRFERTTLQLANIDLHLGRRTDEVTIESRTWERDSTAKMLEIVMASLPKNHEFDMIDHEHVDKRKEHVKEILKGFDIESDEITNVVPISTATGRIPVQRSNGEAYFKQTSS